MIQCRHLSERVIFLERNKGGTGIKPANLFFIELIIVLLFFSFSAAVILQIFAAADQRQDNGDAVEKAVICSQSLAEAFSVTGNLSEASEIVFGDCMGEFNENRAEIRLDSGMKPNENGEVILYMNQLSQKSEAGVLERLRFEFRTTEGQLIPEIICEAYFPDEGGAADE